MVINRVGPLSCAKVAGVLYALVGALAGCVVALAAMAGGLASDGVELPGLGMAVGLGAIIMLPLLYGVLGFVGTLIGAWLYNLVAAMVGGIELDIR